MCVYVEERPQESVSKTRRLKRSTLLKSRAENPPAVEADDPKPLWRRRWLDVTEVQNQAI